MATPLTVIPIQVTDEGVLIPKTYLHDAGQIEVIVTDDYVLVRAKTPTSQEGTEATPGQEPDFDFVGIGITRDPQASGNAEAILEREIKRTSGWSLDR